MMYNNKLAIAVKANGKVLREFKDTAFIPFGSEYTLLIKNLNTVRVEVRVDIDGTAATDGTALVIAPNSEVELTRFIKNGNLEQGNRFKFIERTAGVEKHRGVKLEDGLIRVEYQFEEVRPTPPVWPSDHWIKKEVWTREQRMFDNPNRITYRGPLRGFKSPTAVGATLQSSIVNQAMYAANAVNSTSFSTAAASSTPSFNDVGITVPGSVSDQKFTVAAWFPVETTKHVMVIKLLGETEAGQPIVAPVTVKAKPKCTSCGHVNKAKSKFCSECGTSLELV